LREAQQEIEAAAAAAAAAAASDSSSENFLSVHEHLDPEASSSTTKHVELKDVSDTVIPKTSGFNAEQTDVTSQTIKPKKARDILLSEGPDLYSMGALFLHPVLRIGFYICTLMQFATILISYGLAGPTAYSQLFFIISHIETLNLYWIAPFIIVLAFIIIFCGFLINYVISIFTFFKGTLLITMVIIVGIVGSTINHSSIDQWRYTGRSFLIGTVALGGSISTMPIIYSRMEPTARNIKMFRAAYVMAVGTCWLMNVLWCSFVLMVVPQRANTPDGISLERAAELGQPSTVPLVSILQEQYPEYAWLSYVVAVFIVVSITVSYIAMGSGLKHLIDGFVKSFNKSMETPGTILDKLTSCGFCKYRRFLGLFLQLFLYVASFAGILTIAMLNPKSFLVILEVFASLALNLQGGIFVILMLWKSGSPAFKKYVVPLPINWAWFNTIWYTGSYFLVACLYAVVYNIVALFVDPMPF